jgi:Phage integrase SAM-like domain
MASLSSDKSGNRRILFVDGDGKRHSIRIGKVTERVAERIKDRIEALNHVQSTGTDMDNDTRRWLGKVGEKLARKLARAGLTGPPIKRQTLDAFIRNYVASRTDLKQSTITSIGLARQRMLAFFRPDLPLSDLTPADADRFLIHLRGKYAEATAARTFKRARQFFTAAKRGRLIAENPFEGIKPGSMENRERLFFITPEMTAKLTEACPDSQWRAILALCRWGGLRMPLGGLDAVLGRRGLGKGQAAHSLPQDGGSMDSPVRRTTAVPGRAMGRCRAGRRPRHQPIPLDDAEPADDVRQDHQAGGAAPLAAAHAEPAQFQRDGVERPVPLARRGPVDRQQRTDRGQALLASHGRRL